MVVSVQPVQWAWWSGKSAKIQGCRVVGIAGSEEKIGLLKMSLALMRLSITKPQPIWQRQFIRSLSRWCGHLFRQCGRRNIRCGYAQPELFCAHSLYAAKSRYTTIPNFQQAHDYKLFYHKKCVDGGLYRKQLPTSFAEGIQHPAQWVKEGKLQFTETFCARL